MTDYSYAGYCRTCGALCAAAVDDVDMTDRTAKWVAEMIADGLRVERVTDDVIRAEFRRCECENSLTG